MTWHKITLDNNQISAGELIRLQEKLEIAFNVPSVSRKIVVMCDSFPQAQIVDKKPSHNITVYFSPDCTECIPEILSNYSGVPCERPDFSELAFFAGNKDAI